MLLSFGKYTLSIKLMPALASRRIYSFGLDVAKITTFIEVGKEDQAGGPIYFLGIGRWAFCAQRFDVNYLPKYWDEDKERVRKFRESLQEMFPTQVPPPPPPRQAVADPNVIKFPGKTEQDKVN